MARRRFTEREVLATLIWQGIAVFCYRCKEPFTLETVDKAEREHLHELALGGEDKPPNCRYSHSACHKKVTNGLAATTYGSSKHIIAKAKRVADKHIGAKTAKGWSRWRKKKDFVPRNPKQIHEDL